MEITRTWLLLVALTLVTLIVGHPGSQESLGIAALGVLLCASGLKAAQILRHFLGLRRAGAGWQVLFHGYLVLIAAVILGAYVAGQYARRDAVHRESCGRATPAACRPSSPPVPDAGVRPGRFSTPCGALRCPA